MRSAIVMTAALATAVLASPLQHLEKRKMETVYHEVVETQVVTVTRTGTPPQPTMVYKDNDDSAAQNQPQGGSNRHRGGAKNRPPTNNPEPTSEAAQAPTEAPTYEPPAETPDSDDDKPEQGTPPTSGGDAPSAPESNSYSDVALWHHNVHRANHSAPFLVWSDKLAATAQRIANTCFYEHNTEMDGGGYGQNIAAGVRGENVGEVISDLFYNAELDAYATASGQFTTEPAMGNFHVWGHFSQIAWKGTTEVGCATSNTDVCPTIGNTGSGVEPYFTVCNYGGPGNYAGMYKKNIDGPAGKPTLKGKQKTYNN